MTKDLECSSHFLRSYILPLLLSRSYNYSTKYLKCYNRYAWSVWWLNKFEIATLHYIRGKVKNDNLSLNIPDVLAFPVKAHTDLRDQRLYLLKSLTRQVMKAKFYNVPSFHIECADTNQIYQQKMIFVQYITVQYTILPCLMNPLEKLKLFTRIYQLCQFLSSGL